MLLFFISASITYHFIAVVVVLAGSVIAVMEVEGVAVVQRLGSIRDLHQLVAVVADGQAVYQPTCPDGSDEHRHQEKQDDMS